MRGRGVNHAETLAAIPPAGWALLFCLLGLLGAVLAGAFNLLLKRDVRMKHFEVRAREEKSHLEKELRVERGRIAQDSAAALISNQYSFAKGLLRKMWADLFEAGKECLALSDRRDVFLLRDITHLVEDTVAHEVLLDLVRNHVSEKSDEELALYAEAKAKSYWHFVKTELYRYSSQLDGEDLGSIMDCVPEQDFRDLFLDIYSGARHIAAGLPL